MSIRLLRSGQSEGFDWIFRGNNWNYWLIKLFYFIQYAVAYIFLAAIETIWTFEPWPRAENDAKFHLALYTTGLIGRPSDSDASEHNNGSTKIKDR